MIKFSNIKPGDLVMAEYDGQMTQGIVKDVNREDKEVCVETEVQEFWFKPDHLYPIPIDETQLSKLGFTSQPVDNGGVKYMKDSFRIFLPKKGDFSDMEMWWREDRRRVHQPFYLHDLQNHYYDMTKVELNQ
jgi:hypothetical protein